MEGLLREALEVGLLWGYSGVGLSCHEAGWVMKEVGIRSEANYRKIRVAIKDSTGLRIPMKTDGCSECPMCGYCWDSKSASN